MPHLVISLLGAFSVRLDGEGITDFGYDKVRALLAYLAIESQRPHRRDRLVGLLWPDQPQSEARRNLRAALYRLRSAIHDRSARPPFLLITRDSLQLNPDAGIEVDVGRFADLIAASRSHVHARGEECTDCAQRMTDAADLYRGDLLQGFACDSAPYEEWMVLQREALHQQALDVLDQLATHHEALGHYDQALAYARRQIALEPWREHAHRQAMRALALAGQRAAALAQFGACHKILHDELGIDADTSSHELYERIRSGALQPPVLSTSATPEPTAVSRTPQPIEPLPSPPAPERLAEPRTLEGERRWVTLILADVTASQALLQEEGVEAWVEVLGPGLELLAGEARRVGGVFRQVGGDQATVTFGTAVTQEDDPERAVLAAHAMQRTFASYLREIGEDRLGLRISVHRGEAIVTTVDGASSAMGEVFAVAERIHATIDPDTIWVDEPTHHLAAAAFEWQPLANGAYRPLAHLRAIGKGRGLPGLSSPLVGRDRELRALDEAIGRLSAGVGGIVTVVGEAGIGKSRLVAEARKAEWKNQESANAESRMADPGAAPPHSPFADSAFLHSEPRWIEGRCLSYATHVAYQMWVDVVRALVDASSDTPPVEVRDALRRAVRALCPGQFTDVYPLLAWLMTLPLGQAAQARLRGIDAEGLRVLAFRAVERLLEGAASQGPLVIALEDLHWADATSLDLLEHLLRLTERTPLLFICVMRPETEHRCWRIRELAGRDYYHRHTDLRLAPLTEKQSAALVSHLLTVEDLPAELRARVLARAGGNPFFLEEILRALIDDAAITYSEETHQWHAGSDTSDLPIPATLHGVITSRIDRLPQEAKQVLQLAAVVGRIVPRPLLTAIAGHDGLDDHLRILQRAELLRERARLPEVEYIFKHQLTQEAAYAGLLRRKRRTLHRRIAEALELQYADRIEEQLGLLAHHWERAGDAERAVHYLRHAGAQAAAQYANEEALDCLSRALDLLPADEADTRFELLLIREGVHNIQGARTAQRRGLEALTALATSVADDTPQHVHRLAQIALREANYFARIGDWSAAGVASSRAIRLARKAQDRTAEATAYLYLSRARDRDRDSLDRALALARAAGCRQVEADVLRETGLSITNNGHPTEAWSYLEQALAIYRELGDRMGEGKTLNALGHSYSQAGHLTQAKDLTEQGRRLCRATGNRFEEMYATWTVGVIIEMQGDDARSKRFYEQALETCHQIHMEGLIPGLHATLGRVAAKLGDTKAARDHYNHALGTGITGNESQGLCANLAELARHIGDNAAARAICELALQHPASQPYDTMELFIILGHALVGFGLLQEAAEAYRRATALRKEYGSVFRIMESEVGLAQVYLAQGDCAQALAHVETILVYLADHPALEGSTNRYPVFMMCYQVLAAVDDPRAQDVLEADYNLLMEGAAKIEDPTTRRSFLENVPVNREIVGIWERLQGAQAGAGG